MLDQDLLLEFQFFHQLVHFDYLKIVLHYLFLKTFQSGEKVEGEIVRVLDKGIILGLEHDVEGIIPFSRQTKRNKKSISSKYKIGQKMSAVVMEIKSDDKKVILFVEELSGEKPSERDNVKQFLDNQSEPVGEKIEIPTEDLDHASDINED